MKTMRGLSQLIALAIFFNLSACASAQQGGAFRPPEPKTFVVVQNDNYWDAKIYLLSDGQKTRLGLVEGHTNQKLRMPRNVNFLGNLRFVIHFIGGQDYATDYFITNPGQKICLQIGASPSLTNVWQC